MTKQTEKEIKNLINEKVSLNENELKFLKHLSKQDEYDNGTLIGIPDIYIDGLTKNQIKGYISDLDRKFLINILDGEEYGFGCDCLALRNEIIEQL